MTTITIKDAVSPVQRKVKRGLKGLLFLNGLAILITTYLTYLHFKPSASTICKINEYFDCDIVNKSTYSELFGVPVAILGLLTYLLLFALSWAIYKGKRLTTWSKHLTVHNLLWFMFVFVDVGILFSGYLTYIELFVLQAVCIFCLAQQIIIILEMFVLLGILSTIDKGKRENPNVCEFC